MSSENPFENIFGDLARILSSSSQGSLNWDVANQIAVLIAGEGQAEPNVDPSDRIRVEELARVAELHVNQRIDSSVSIRTVEVENHVGWAHRTLRDYRSLLEKLSTSLNPQNNESQVETDEFTSSPMAAQFAQMERFMGPILMGMQAGGMIGHLSRRTFGQFDLPIPRPNMNALVLVPQNIGDFASDWSLEKDELMLYVALEEIVRTSVLLRPHVSDRILSLIAEYVSGFEVSSVGLQDRFNELEFGDPEQIPAILSDPQALLGAIQSPGQQIILGQLSAIVAALCGYVDYLVKDIAPRVMASSLVINEAIKRRRVEETDGNRLAERLFGLELSQSQFDLGESFVLGVIERAGEEGLVKLWKSEKELPTPAEIRAPGLWLERISYL